MVVDIVDDVVYADSPLVVNSAHSPLVVDIVDAVDEDAAYSQLIVVYVVDAAAGS